MSHSSPRAPEIQSDATALAWATLHALGVGSSRVACVAAAGGPEAVCRALLTHPGSAPSSLLRAVFGAERAAAWSAGPPLEGHVLRAWWAALRAHLRGGGRIWSPGPPEGRDRLARAPGAPLCAYGRGPDPRGSPARRIAVVGTRLPSPGGEACAVRLGADLGARGVWVISGGARGIDLAAHRGCLAVGGPTLAVLGEPLPGEGAELPARLHALGNGLGSLCPFGPWVAPARHLFAARNRWLVALTDAVVVVEAAPRSGTWHTIRAARRLGVPILAVSTAYDPYLSATPQRLLREGLARPCSDAASLLRALEAFPAPPLPLFPARSG